MDEWQGSQLKWAILQTLLEFRFAFCFFSSSQLPGARLVAAFATSKLCFGECKSPVTVCTVLIQIQQIVFIVKSFKATGSDWILIDIIIWFICVWKSDVLISGVWMCVSCLTLSVKTHVVVLQLSTWTTLDCSITEIIKTDLGWQNVSIISWGWTINDW